MRNKYDVLIEKFLSFFKNEENLKTHYKKRIEEDYLSGLAELEIAALLFQKGVYIDPDPKVNDKRSDLRFKIKNRDIFIEITVIKEVSEDVIREPPSRHRHFAIFEIPSWKEREEREPEQKFLLDKIVNKIIEEIIQLPENNPNVLIINIEFHTPPHPNP